MFFANAGDFLDRARESVDNHLEKTGAENIFPTLPTAVEAYRNRATV